MFANSNKKSDNQAIESDKSYVSPPPTVSLPKGGGAIKGMGEKFAANPVTGTGSMSVPIVTSPSRSGFGPQLSLSYDSGAGNGIFGLGWNLSLPSITRKTDKGLPRYLDSSESDIFILSGAEDLVPVLKADGNRDILDSSDRQFKIQRYRPRIEGLFARIERWTKLDSGEIHWRSISKDNISTLYGKTENSRIADPDNPTHVFSWLICESYDDKGNAIYYSYRSEDKDNSSGIDLAQANERNRTPKSRSANRYLKHIYYGNLTPRQVDEDLKPRKDWLFEVVFDYGEHDLFKPIPLEPKEWTTATLRNDPFSSFRSGFEVRTYRLCQRVLMFHHFPEEESVGKDYLVRSTDFIYSYEQNTTDVRNPIYSLLLSVKQTGYKRNSEGGYIQKSLPPLEFTYTEANIDETVREVDRASLENLPQGLDGTRYQWVDLDGEGLSGILTEQGNGWFYKRNLSPINNVKINGSKQIEAHFAPVELVASKPATGLNNGAQFLDLASDGQLDLVTLRSPNPGFYERTHNEDWESFVAFKSLPNLDWDNPNLKFIDLNGDGHSDILITEDNCFVWHPSLAEDGFDAAERVYQPWDEEKGPRVVFADSTQSIYLADMSGDGLTDIVRIRNGEVCYWANLGYGRFSAKVTMDNSPWFDSPEIFNQRRILLADIDGSGTTDILYLSGEGVQVYFNQLGNSWSAKRVLKSFPAIDNVVSVTTIDLLGNGTACLVWSSPLSGSAPRVMRYIDLMGGQKPHLLIKTTNNMGAETVVQYAPSTKFYLQDKLAGKPWITKLPFPVHVVERVETYDRISRNRFVTRYVYHHGYFDGVEREFRGFGMVEQWDTEEIGTIKAQDTSSDSTNLDVASFVPPVHTKTWFHTGVYLERDRISNFFAEEYYREPGVNETEFKATLLPDTVLPIGLKLADNSVLSRSLMIAEEYEACRSLKGRILRQEIYAIDGLEKSQYPYSVSERNYEICWLQPKQDKQHAVFYTHDRWILNNVAGKPIRMWDSRNHILRTNYDQLLRPTQLFVKAGNEPEILAEKTVYGEGKGDVKNHRGRIYQHFDSAGVATNVEFDFKGNLERSTRQLVKDYTKIPNWLDNPVLETEIFSSSTRYDALNRPIQLVAPHSSKQNTKLNIIRPGYNEANLLERMDVWLGETAEPIALLVPQSANFHAVTNIGYNAKEQRTLIEYGNGAKTEYTYDKKTFRLTNLKTTRGGAVFQDLFYIYDPVGNITRIRDDAQQTIFFKGQVVLPQCDYIYDAIYRLIEATGREHIGQIGQPETTWNDEFRVNLPHPNDGKAMRNYTEQYLYDAVGNFEQLIHQAENGNWIRAYAYNEASLIEPAKKSNRLSSTNVGVKTEPSYIYDAHGNMTSMPHLMLMQWNYKDELSATSRQAVNDAPPPDKVPEMTFYVYDASGQRVRKVTKRQNGTRKNERIYLGGFEIYREFESDENDIKLERETLHVMDDKQRIALVETKTITNPDDESPVQLIRFQFGNHLGSASLELDDKANVISYEEYYPYGSTAYQAVDKSIKAAAKRYRYTGKERDEETGLYYHGARYYAPWLGRWTSCDPAGVVDGINLFVYSRDNPIRFIDPGGFQSCNPNIASCLPDPSEVYNAPNKSSLNNTMKEEVEKLNQENERALKLLHTEGVQSSSQTIDLNAQVKEGYQKYLEHLATPRSAPPELSIEDAIKIAWERGSTKDKAVLSLTGIGLASGVIPYVGDYISLAASVGVFTLDPSLSNLGDVGLNAVGAALPFVPALGTLRKGKKIVNAAEKVGETATLARNAEKLSNAAEDAHFVYQLVDREGDAIRYGITNNPERRLYEYVKPSSKDYFKGQIAGMQVISEQLALPQALTLETSLIRQARVEGRLIYNTEKNTLFGLGGRFDAMQGYFNVPKTIAPNQTLLRPDYFKFQVRF